MLSLFKKFFYIYLLLFSELIYAHDISNFFEENYQQFLKLDKDGIKVFIYNYEKNKIKAFAAVTYINAPIDSILAVLFDDKKGREWIHACDDSYMIENISFTERYHYQVIDIPFPFEDRDFIFHSKMEQSPLTEAVTITINARPNYCKTQNSELCQQVNQSKHVRVEHSVGVYRLEPVSNGTIVTWIQHTNPEGNLPSWLVNQLLVDTPYWTLKNLSQKVKEVQYKSAKLIYDNDGTAVKIKINPTNKSKKVFVTFPSF